MASLLVMALLHAFKPVLTPAPDAAAVNAFTYRLETLRAQDVAQKLRAADGRPAMLFVYASWCSFCRQMMPDIADLVRAGKLDGVATLFISRDRSASQLSRYLVATGYDELVTPYLISSTEAEALQGVLQRAGGSFANAIPYVAFFGADGRIAAEIHGAAGRGALLAALDRAARNTH